MDSKRGNDAIGGGAEARPLKTITRATRVCAAAGDVIKVQAALPYDSANGEVFPIGLRARVELEGVPRVVIGGKLKPVISGGGYYEALGDPDGSRYVSVIGARGATITGFRFVVFDSPVGGVNGVSVLADSEAFYIIDNEFGGPGHTSIALFGRSYGFIQGNLFRKSIEGSPRWGVAAYGESQPGLRSNEFYVDNGVFATDSTRIQIDGNVLTTKGVGIELDGLATAYIQDNVISGNRDLGILVGGASWVSAWYNEIVDNPTGMRIEGGAPCPAVSLGTGLSSSGHNVFDNRNWDIENWCSNAIGALDNSWSHSPDCIAIDSQDIFDDDEELTAGPVVFARTPCAE